MKYQFTYILRLQYLGFRLHGWQKQPDLKTVHFIVDKTLKFVLGSLVTKKTVGVGRTDAKVSALDYYIQLFTDKEIAFKEFIANFNKNSPADVRLLSIEQKEDMNFNIIQSKKIKEYRYYFSYGEKIHPYCAPFLVGFQDELNIDLMKKGAKLFEGLHNFKMYCAKPHNDKKFMRTIDECRLMKNTDMRASFFPEKSYVLVVRGEGFLRNQIRLMMGALVELGKGSIDLDFIRTSLTGKVEGTFIKTIVPASGLHLYKVELL